MKRANRILVPALGVVVAVVVLVLRSAPSPADDKKDDVKKVREIPIEAIYSTSHQKELRPIWKETDKVSERFLEQLEHPDAFTLNNLEAVTK